MNCCKLSLTTAERLKSFSYFTGGDDVQDIVWWRYVKGYRMVEICKGIEEAGDL